MTTLNHPIVENFSGMDPFEKRLEQLLSPREANPEFVEKLKYRLQSQPMITLETRRKIKAFWFLAAGLFVGALIIFLTTRKR